MLSFQHIILRLQAYWSERGCALLQPYDMEVGAGTSHTATFLRALGPEPWKAAYVQPSRRPKDGRYGQNPNRLQHYYQYQVIMKPSPPDAQDLLLASYMRAILMLSLATFTSYSIFFSIIGVPYAILLAALAGTLEMIPTIGSFTAGLVIVIVSAISGGPVWGAVIFLLLYRLFQDYVLSPVLMRAGMELHPLMVLFGVFAGAEVAGVAGAFLSVPLLALVRVMYRHIRKLRAVAISETRLPVVRT